MASRPACSAHFANRGTPTPDGVPYGSRWSRAKRETTGTTTAPDFPTAAAVAEGIHAAWYLVRDALRGRTPIADIHPVVSRFASDHRLPYVTPSGVGSANGTLASRRLARLRPRCRMGGWRRRRVTSECWGRLGGGRQRFVLERVEDVRERIDRVVVQAHLVVQVRAGGAAGRADVADDVAALHVLSRLGRVARKMAVAG